MEFGIDPGSLPGRVIPKTVKRELSLPRMAFAVEGKRNDLLESTGIRVRVVQLTSLP